MPANLPPQYYELEREFRAEKDLREKLRLAQELLVLMPKHKGTDKLQADMKAKISKLKKTIEGGQSKHGAKQATAVDHFIKEGAGQIVLIGPPNSGKSSLMDALTHANPLIADYPFTTREPAAGMMTFETVQIELIDTPPISAESFEGYLASLIRNADIICLVADLETDRVAKDIELVIEALEEKRIVLKPNLHEKPEDARYAYKKTVICAHKEYEDESGERLATLRQMFPDFVIAATSILDDQSLKNLKKMLFESLEVIRVYTKRIGHDVDRKDPIILPVGGTVDDAANTLHKDFAQKLKFARVWGDGKFDGQRVQRDFRLSDEDVIEFHL